MELQDDNKLANKGCLVKARVFPLVTYGCWQMLGKIEGRRRRGWQRMRWLDGVSDSWTWVWANSGRQWRTGESGVLQSMGCKESDMTERLNWTELSNNEGFSGGAGGKEPACQCRRCKGCGFDPQVRKIPWRKKWQATPVFLPRESHGQRSLAGHSPWAHKESETTEWLSTSTASVMMKMMARMRWWWY